MGRPNDASTPDPVVEDPVGGMFAAGRVIFFSLLGLVSPTWILTVDQVGVIQIALCVAYVATLIVSAYLGVREFMRARRIARSRPSPRLW